MKLEFRMKIYHVEMKTYLRHEVATYISPRQRLGASNHQSRFARDSDSVSRDVFAPRERYTAIQYPTRCVGLVSDALSARRTMKQQP